MAAIDAKILRGLGWNVQGDLGPWTMYTSRRAGLVYFDRAPPLTPPSAAQLHQQNQFRLAAILWQALTQNRRDRWEAASLAARLRITGYNLFVYHALTNDHATIQTIERITNTNLLASFP